MLRASLLGGANAALGSVVAKMAFDDRFLVRHVFGGEQAGTLAVLGVRGLGLALMLALNAMLFRFLALGMDQAGSTVSVTAMVSATNFVLSGFFGWLLFGELISASWLLGSMLMVVGVWMLNV